MPANPFITFDLAPSYGLLKVVLHWSVNSALPATFTVLRSYDGLNDWQTIGNTVLNTFTDDAVIEGGKLQEFYYQVRMTQDGKTWLSPSIATFGKATRAEFGMARTIMELESRQLRMHTRVRVFKLKRFAGVCPICTDEDTGQNVGTTLCVACFGTGKEGGYYLPGIDSYMRLITESPIIQDDDMDGTGSADPAQAKARMLAFPLLAFEDLIVNLNNDRRYFVEKIDLAKVNAKLPVTANLDLVVLRRSDVRYQLPV